eukprot:scaffold51_cov172-Ochromonas_danica.AAC.9
MSDQADKDYRTLQSETAKHHGGKIPKGSEAAKAQSKAEADEDKDFNTTLVRGIAQSQGEKPPEAVLEHHVSLPEDTMKQEEQLLEEKRRKTEEEMQKSSHFANTTTP